MMPLPLQAPVTWELLPGKGSPLTGEASPIIAGLTPTGLPLRPL
jgi:hypothetical protein